MIGLGGVVWGIDCLHLNTFPVRWISTQPIADVPINLIFYNILVPLIVKLFQPTEAWNKVFEWWFRTWGCWLRLSDFLFGVKQPKEGLRQASKKWPHQWEHIITLENRDPALMAALEGLGDQQHQMCHTTADGSYARVPASDAVKPPRGHSAFLPVDRYNKRLDGQHDHEFGCHGHKDPKWTMVYIPPNFRLRIVALVAAMWLFLVVAGCSVTLLPLLMGRAIVAAMVKDVDGMSDIYAFSIGVAILPLPIYAHKRQRAIRRWLHDTLEALPRSLSLRNGLVAVTRLAGLAYFYSTLLLIFPLLLSFTLRIYIIIPFHTYFTYNSATLYSSSPHTPLSSHTVHLLQEWTLGLLYLRLIIKYTLARPNSRPARAMLMVLSNNNWWDPNIRAFTRIWVFPIMLLAADALFTPLAVAWVVLKTRIPDLVYTGKSSALSVSMNDHSQGQQVPSLRRVLIYRYSYSFVIFFFLALVMAVKGIHWFQGWKKRIRDEVYLIGERLHNYKGERKKERKVEGKGKGKGKAKDQGSRKSAGSGESERNLTGVNWNLVKEKRRLEKQMKVLDEELERSAREMRRVVEERRGGDTSSAGTDAGTYTDIVSAKLEERTKNLERLWTLDAADDDRSDATPSPSTPPIHPATVTASSSSSRGSDSSTHQKTNRPEY